MDGGDGCCRGVVVEGGGKSCRVGRRRRDTVGKRSVEGSVVRGCMFEGRRRMKRERKR